MIDMITPDAQKVIADAFIEWDTEQDKIQNARDMCKDIITVVHESTGIEKQIIRKLFSMHRNDTKTKLESDVSDLIDLHQSVFEQPNV